MKHTIFLALILLFSQMTIAGVTSSKTDKNQNTKRAQLGTSFKFNGSQLRGKYQSSLNTSATVENDKLLEDLLKGRTEFADRLEEENERN